MLLGTSGDISYSNREALSPDEDAEALDKAGLVGQTVTGVCWLTPRDGRCINVEIMI